LVGSRRQVLLALEMAISASLLRKLKWQALSPREAEMPSLPGRRVLWNPEYNRVGR
jgi:hypothetical protein